ncbi:hypothetical protein CEXT_533871 [Caerostris extrusa]|uniref:Uncharacterized protein n=1 Tax=Caerostris extrusa TaxID=172846 RepID=A0AAV4MZH6_CAEEX|nr:hypothetical protein CEXT_533871 [Caerostris extrusa]
MAANSETNLIENKRNQNCHRMISQTAYLQTPYSSLCVSVGQGLGENILIQSLMRGLWVICPDAVLKLLNKLLKKRERHILKQAKTHTEENPRVPDSIGRSPSSPTPSLTRVPSACLTRVWLSLDIRDTCQTLSVGITDKNRRSICLVK